MKLVLGDHQFRYRRRRQQPALADRLFRSLHPRKPDRGSILSDAGTADWSRRFRVAYE